MPDVSIKQKIYIYLSHALGVIASQKAGNPLNIPTVQALFAGILRVIYSGISLPLCTALAVRFMGVK